MSPKNPEVCETEELNHDMTVESTIDTNKVFEFSNRTDYIEDEWDNWFPWEGGHF
jgi:hypothetical protein